MAFGAILQRRPACGWATLQIGHTREFKKNIVITSWFCVFLAFYFYRRHNEYCEPYIYTGFAICESLVVCCSIWWHARNISLFVGYRLVAEPYMDLK